jgi:hypothetical protein
MMKQVFILIFILFLPLCVFSLPVESLVSPAHLAQLRASSEIIIETQLRNPVPVLQPQNIELREFIARVRGALNPNMMIESLYLYEKPENFRTSSDTWDEYQKTVIFNQLLAISTLTGIQYFSASRNAMRTFYEFSSVIDGPQTRNALPDPVYTELPAAVTFYARQRDLSFGDNIFRYDFVNTRNVVFFMQENVTALSYGIIPAIGRGNLRSIMAVIDCGDVILMYVISMVRASAVPGVGDRIRNSFGNRAQAVLNWFTGRLDSELFL